MSKIIGVTVGTPISPEKIEREIQPVKTINGIAPDANGNVNVQGGGGVDENVLERIGALEDAVDELNEAYENLGSDVEDIARPIAVEEANRVRESVDTVSNRATILEQKVSTLEGKTSALENKTATLENKTSTLENKLGSVTLGIHTDGLLYVFVNGTPVGGGITLPEGASGDIAGNFDSEGRLILTGDIPDGTYVGYITENGNTIRIGNVDLYCSITNNLTCCTNSNKATSVANGGSYSATITANSGYTLKTVTATMGGSAVSVNGGTINIAKVTGDIVITAVAEEIPVAEPVTVNIGLTDKYAIDTNGNLRGSQSNGYATTDFIDVTNIPKPCTIHLTGAQWITPVESGYVRFFVADASGNKILGGNTMMKYIPDGMAVASNNTNSDDVTFTITSDNIGKLRFTGLYGTGNGYTGTGNFSGVTATLTYTPN